MAHSAPSHRQPIQVSAAANEPTDNPPRSLDSRNNTGFSSDLKRLGVSLSWKSWKSSKLRTNSETSLSTLPACNHGWKPNTMKKRVLVPMAIWTAVLAAVIEFLAQKSSREGGLALSTKPDDVSDTAEFCYKVLPTIFAVILSIAWTWVDLDVKRMQPWMELSKEGGAAVRDSLMLDYPYDFVAWVPFKAWKRRHWNVFLTGTIMVLIFWVITPLQGAIFGNGSIKLSRPVSFSPSSQILPTQNQSRAMDTSILNHLYATKWLDQPYPPFTNTEYALQPFNLSSAPTSGVMNWTTTTTKFWTDLRCWPAEWTPNNMYEGYFDYHNGQGCNASGIVTVRKITDTPRQLQYLGWYNTAYAEQYLSGPTCGSEFSNQFLAVMSKGDPKDYRITALFCEPSYWKQLVEVRLPSDTYRPENASVTPAGPVEELPITEFNSTAFEFLLGASVPEDQDIDRDYPDDQIVDQLDRVHELGLHWPLAPLVAFAVGGQNRSADDYFDEAVLAESFRTVHKSAFVLAYNSLLSRSTTDASIDGTAEFVLHGIKVSRPISAVVESLLLVVGICSILLSVLTTRIKSNLTANPASLGDILTLLQNSPELVESATVKSDTLEMDPSIACAEPRLQLRCGCLNSSGCMSVHVTGTPRFTRIPLAVSEDSKQNKGASQFEPVRPLVFRKFSGIPFVLVLAASLAVLLYLKHQEQHLGGIPRPTDSFEVLQLLENYIPTTIATLIEPYWVLVSRMLCIFQPFHDLWRGKGGAKSRRAVDAKYTAVPPQLSIWGALRAGHILLVAVGSMALLGNVLAVGLGDLFNEKTVKVSYPTDLVHLHSYQFAIDDLPPSSPNNGRQNDVFTSIKSNLTMGTPMPPWITEEYYFQPFGAQSPIADNTTETYRARTRGYGLQITCEPGPTAVSEGDKDEFYSVDIGDLKKRHGFTDQDCEDAVTVSSLPSLNESSVMEGAMGLCDLSFLLVFWGRATSNPDPAVDFESHACFPKFQTAPFDVSVNGEGRVMSYDRAGDFSDDLGYEKSGKHIDQLLENSLDIIGLFPAHWHADKKSMTWFGDMLKVMAGERIMDPAEPMPGGEEMVRLTKDIWRRSFAYFLGLDVIQYAPVAADERPMAGKRIVTETRIFMSVGSYIVSITILSLYILVALVLYASSMNFVLPRMPTTVAAILEFAGQSRALQAYTPSPEVKSRLRFGGYVGRDGEKHMGIEFAEFITPAESIVPRKQWKWFGRDFLSFRMRRRR